MNDPDAINAINGRHVYWLVINIKDNINNGNTILSYQGPAPPYKSGKHTYIFKLYEQPKMLNIETITERSIPIKLLVNKYASKIQFISENECGGKIKKQKNAQEV